MKPLVAPEISVVKLTAPMQSMLSKFAEGCSGWAATVGVRGANATLNALVTRGLVKIVPLGSKFGSADCVEFKITDMGRANVTLPINNDQRDAARIFA